MTKLKINKTSRITPELKNRLATGNISSPCSKCDCFENLFNNMISGGMIFEAIDDGQDFIIIDFNCKAERIEKKVKIEVIGRRLSDVFPEMIGDGLFNVIQKVHTTGNSIFYPSFRYYDSQLIQKRDNLIFKLNNGALVLVFDDQTHHIKIESALNGRIKELRALCSISLLKDEYPDDYQKFMGKALNLITISFQYPDIAVGRIKIDDQLYMTGNFKETEFKISSNIIINGELVGSIEIFYLEEAPQACEGPFKYEEIVLLNIFSREIGKYYEHYIANKKIKKIMGDLKAEREVLNDKNIALKEVLNQINSEKEQFAHQIMSNINKVTMPILSRLENKVDENGKEYVKLLRKTLEDISLPLINQNEANLNKLTPREIEITHMIKNGLSTKDMAYMLDVSPETIRSQRKNIRSKLGLTNQKANLSSYLKTS